jgi:hypothetical protein
VTTLADAEQWRHTHRRCADEGPYRSLEQARFVAAIHSGHGGTCHQYLAAHAYSLGSGDVADHD